MYFLKNKYLWCCAVVLFFDIESSGNESVLLRPTVSGSSFTIMQKGGEVAAVSIAQEMWRKATHESIQELLSTSMHQEGLNQGILAEFAIMKQTISDLQGRDQAKDREIEWLRQQHAAMSQRMEEMVVEHARLAVLVKQPIQQEQI